MQTANEDYKAPLRGWAAIIARLLTQLLGLFTSRIQDPEVRLMATGALTGAKDTVEALSDADPDDAEQLREILNRLFREGDFKTGAQQELLGKINELQNEDVRRALNILNGHAFPIADMLTDDDPANTEQLKDHLANLLRSEDGVALFQSLLRIVMPAQTADLITLVIVQALLGILAESEGEDITDTAAKLVAMRQKIEAKMGLAA